MKKTFTFNELGVCPSPYVDFKSLCGPVTIKVFTACHNERWFFGYHLGIYLPSDAGVSQLVYPNRNHQSFQTHARAVQAAVWAVALELSKRTGLDGAIAHTYPVARFNEFKTQTLKK